MGTAGASIGCHELLRVRLCQGQAERGLMRPMGFPHPPMGRTLQAERGVG